MLVICLEGAPDSRHGVPDMKHEYFYDLIVVVSLYILQGGVCETSTPAIVNQATQICSVTTRHEPTYQTPCPAPWVTIDP